MNDAIAFSTFTHFGGFDWAMEKHQMTVVDLQGQVRLRLCFEDNAQGWAQLREQLRDFGALAVAIETNCGPAVERLLEMGLTIYPLNPKAAERYRDRKNPAGNKNDPLDGYCFADALRTDGHAWRALLPADPLTMELRLLCRDEVALIEQRTALALQLRAALHEYYPAALEAFEDWTAEEPWAFILAFSTPQALAGAGRRKWEKFLHVHKLYRPQTVERRMEIFARATHFASPNPAVTRAKSLLATTLARQLVTLQKQLDEYRDRIRQLFNDHPDKDCFGSLPGAGEKLAPRLLSELGSDRRVFDSHDALRAYSGTAPVTQQSGKSRHVILRRACNNHLRHAVHLWADLSRKCCAWAQAYYQQKRAQGQAHAAALRCLGQRWLKILWKMWKEGTRYDEALHTRNQVKHGSWVIGLTPTNPKP